MNGIHTTIYEGCNLTVHVVTGRIGNDEVADALRNLPEKCTGDVIWDFTCGNAMGLLSSYKPKNLSSLLGQYGAVRKGGRTAMVFSRDIDYGIGNIIESYFNMIGNTVAVKSFRTMNDAFAWLGIAPHEAGMETVRQTSI